jgi:iron complex outermembrane receptor protein
MSAPALLVGVRTEAADNDYRFADDGGTHFVEGDGALRNRENADASLLDLWVLGRAAGVRLLVNRVEREQGAPKLVLLPSRAARAAFTRTLAAVETRAPIGGEGGFFEAQTSAVATTSLLDDPQFELALRTARLETRGERVAQRLAGRVDFGSIVLRPALDVSVERLRRFEGATGETSHGARDPSLVAHRHAARMAGAVRFAASEHLAIRILAATECHATRGALSAGPAGCEAEPTGRAGVRGEIDGLAVYANGSRYSRPPSLGELYGASIVVRGNSRLRPEVGWSADAGVRWLARRPHSGRVRRRQGWVDAAIFSRWAEELVSFVRSSEGFVQPVNLRSAQVRGLEIDVGSAWWACCVARVSLTATDPRDTTAGRATRNDVLPFVSRLVVVPSLAASVDIAERALRRVGAELRYVYQSSRFADAAGLAVIPAQGSLDAEANVDVAAGEAAMRARVRVANVLNEVRFDVVGFPLPGRSAFVSLEVMW